MTIKEALIAALGIHVGSNTLNKVLEDSGLIPDAEYIPNAHSRKVDMAAIEALFSLYGVNSKSEGDMSISYNGKELKERLLFLARKYNRADIINAIEPRATVGSVRRM